MNLYHVQDDDQPMWVIANDYGDAVHKWKLQISEMDQMSISEVDDPRGVAFVCAEEDLIL